MNRRTAPTPHRSHRLLVVCLLASTLAAPLNMAPAAADPPSVSVSVDVENMVFPDGLHRATFRTVGACVGASDDVEVTDDACGGSAAGATEGTVRKAKLGFSAVRHVEAVGEDLSGVETDFAAAAEQLDLVRVVVHRAGDLAVRMTGSPTPTVDPRPVPGSASAGGELSDRSVVWTLPGMAPGEYTFTAKFRPNADAGFAGTFVPEVVVELSGTTASLLDYEMGSLPAAAPVSRTSTMTMRQRVSPPYGPPAMTTASYHPARAPDRSVWGWDTQVAMDARGAYQATVGGDVEGPATVGKLQDLAPGSAGVVDAAWMASAFRAPYGQSKAWPYIRVDRDPDGKPAAFVTNVETRAMYPYWPVPLVWDRDAVTFGVGAGISTVEGNDEQPDNNEGRLHADGASVNRTWSATWAGLAPGLDNSAARGMHRLVATVPFVVSGGDIDNRSGDKAVFGEEMVIDVPQQQRFAGGLVVSTGIEGTNFRLGFNLGERGRAILKPRVDAGGAWPQSSRNGYDRTWANAGFLSLNYVDDEGAADTADIVNTAAVVVPDGAVADVTGFDVLAGVKETLQLAEGAWEITFSGREGLTAARAARDASGVGPQNA